MRLSCLKGLPMNMSSIGPLVAGAAQFAEEAVKLAGVAGKVLAAIEGGPIGIVFAIGDLLGGLFGGGGPKVELHKPQAATRGYAAPAQPARSKPASAQAARTAPASSSPARGVGQSNQVAAANAGQLSAAREKTFQKHAAVVRENFASFERAGAAFGLADGLLALNDMRAVAQDPGTPPEMRAAAKYFLEHPDLFGRLDTAGGGALLDGLATLDDVDAAIARSRGDRTSSAQPVTARDTGAAGASQQATRAPATPVAPPPLSVSVEAEFQQSARVLLAHFDSAERAGAFLMSSDGLLAQNDLRALVMDNGTPPDLAKAALFFLQHPEQFGRLDTAGGGALQDGLATSTDIEQALQKSVAQGDLTAVPTDAELLQVDPDLHVPQNKKVGTPAKTEARHSPSTSSSSQVKAILDDPKLSAEDKIAMVLDALLSTLDGDLKTSMDDVATAEDRRHAMMTGKASDAEKEKAGMDLDRATQKLQRLMERRKAMMELASTMSSKFSETTSHIIANLGRA